MKINTINLRSNLVAIEQVKETVSSGGLYIPDSKQQDSSYKTGIIVSKGPEALEVNIGDKVLYPAFIGMDATIADKPCTIIYEDDVLCIMES